MTKAMLISACLAAGLAVASPALAWKDSGSYTGPNGGTVNWTQGCGPYHQFCGRKWSATTSEDTTYNGAGTIRHTPYGGYVTNRYLSGPNGSYFRHRRW